MYLPALARWMSCPPPMVDSLTVSDFWQLVTACERILRGGR